MAGTPAARIAPSGPNGRSAAPRPQTAAQGTADGAEPRRPTTARRSPGKQHTRSATKRPAAASPATEPVPRQGFECEIDRASGPVEPPGGAELVSAAAEILGELTKAGLSTSERLLKDVFSRLPLN
jgi:hypothetical protein